MIDKIIDVGIITIIPTEIRALKSIFGIKEEFQHYKQGDINYLKTNMYSPSSKRSISIVISFLNKESGNTESAIATTKFLHEWYPRIMCLVGISAGTYGKAKIGDVVLPAKIHDRQVKVYKNGRYSPRTTTYTRSDFMDGIAKLHGIDVKRFRELCQHELSYEISAAIGARNSLNMDMRNLNENFEVLDGSIVSDNSLIRDESFFEGILSELDEKCRGAEMEAAGFVRACMVENKEFPWIVSRGISDFGDSAKSDTFQMLAAKTACLALREILTNCIDINQLPENMRTQEFEASFEFNIIQQIKNAYDKQNWNEVCRVAPILSRYLWLSGQYQLHIDIGNFVAEAAAYIDKNDLRAMYLIDDVGWTTFICGNKEKAKTYIRDGLRIANEINNYYLSSKAHRHLASIYRRNGQISEARDELKLSVQKAEKIINEHDRKEMLATLQFSEAKILSESHEYEDKRKSIEAFEKALITFNMNGDADRATKVYVKLGNAYLNIGDIGNAKRKYEEGLNAAYSIGRYDEVKANTIALLTVNSDKENQEKLFDKIVEYCRTSKLYTELQFWAKKKEDINYGRQTSFNN